MTKETVITKDIELDEIDVKILEIVQDRGRIRRNDLAEQVSLSLPAASERLRKLEEAGIIEGYHAKVNHRFLYRDITAYMLVNVDSSKHFKSFLLNANQNDEILECHAITGDGTHLLKIRTFNTDSLEKLLAKIQSWTGVTKTTTSLVLSTSKETMRIKPLKK